MLTSTWGVLCSSKMSKWIVAYEADAKLRAIIKELRQGQQNDYKLMPARLLMKKARSVEKIVVSNTLKQEVLRECHDLWAVVHVGICQTMELVERQFH